MARPMEGKVVVVTGGERGIGSAVVRRFLDEGATVVSGDMAPNPQAPSAERDYFQLNVADRASVKQFVDEVVKKHGRIDVLINNAGITRDARLLKMTDEQFDQVIAVNLTGPFNMAKAVAPVMVAQNSGVILNASSVVARGNFGQTNYSASKAGIEAMTVVWAKELAKNGIRVNAIAPGFTETEMVLAMPEKARTAVLEKIPLGRMATPEQIAATYFFAATNESLTGVTITVAGGLVV